MRGHPDSDVSTRAAPWLVKSGSVVWDHVELQQLESLSGESWESGHKTSTERTQRDTEIGDDPECSMLLADVF